MKYARSPLERLTWVGQVQGHPDSVPEDVTTAVAIARFVHSKRGETLCGHDALARILRIKPRQFRNRLARLSGRGHIEIRRHGRAPAGIALIVLPDCILEEDDDFNRQSECPSGNTLERQSECLSSKNPDRQSECLSKSIPDRQCERPLTGNDQKIDHLKSDSYESHNKGEQGNLATGADFFSLETQPESENCFPESLVKKNGRGDGVAARPEGAPAGDFDEDDGELNPGPGPDDELLFDVEPIRAPATRCKAALTREVALDYGVDPRRWEPSP